MLALGAMFGARPAAWRGRDAVRREHKAGYEVVARFKSWSRARISLSTGAGPSRADSRSGPGMGPRRGPSLRREAAQPGPSGDQNVVWA